ncbi:SAC3 family protein 1 [Cercospora zeina]
MSTGRARGRGRGGGLNAPGTTTPGIPTGASRGRGGRFNNGARPTTNTTRGGFGQATAFTGAKTPSVNASRQPPRTTPGASGAPSAAADMDSRWQALRTARDRERKDAIRKGLMSDPDKPMRLSEAITPVGTCQSMCAEYERVQRVVQRDVWDEEKHPNRSPSTPDHEAMDESRMVKKFRRSAAGDEAQLPSDLRPPPVLKKTCDYLFHTILSEAPLAKVHHFVWDRTRAIRNDFSIQQLSKADDLSIAIECFERIARFHILSLHQLALEEKPYEAYNAQQEREQLDKTLLSLMQYYDDCRGRFALPHEAEFRAYCVLFQLQDATPDLEDRVQNWPRAVATDRRVQQALKVYAAACNTWNSQGPFTGVHATPHVVARQDWEMFWQLIKSGGVSYLMACVAEIYFNLVRKMALAAIVRMTRVKTSGPPNTEWTLSSMAKLFYFDDDQQLEDFCGHFSLHFQDLPDGSDRYLDISSITNRVLPEDDGQGPVQLKSYLVESKRERRTLAAIVDGLSVRQAQDQGQLVEEEEESGEEIYGEDGDGMEDVEEEDEEDTLFVPEARKESDATPVPKLSFGQPTSTGLFGKASSSAAPSAFGQPSTAASTLGQPPANTSPFAKPLGGFGQPSQSANPFAPALGSTGKTGGSSLFNNTPTSSAFAQAATAAEPAGLGLVGATSNGDGTNAPKLSFGGINTGQTPAPSAPSLFATKPAAMAPASTPASSLFAPKEPAVSSSTEGEPLGSGNPFATSAAPMFSFPSFAPSEQKSSAEQQNTAGLGQPFGAATIAPSQTAQSELKSIVPPQSPPTTQATPAIASQTTTTAPPPPTSGSSSPPRRLSVLDTKPKRPSPLSNSFTASDEAVADSTRSPSSSQPAKPSLGSQRPLNASAPAATRADSSASEFDAIITRLAKQLVEDPTTGYLKQYVEFSVRGLITEVQEKVYLERINREADDYRQFCLQDKYAKKWREISRMRRLRRQQAERRKRQQRRLQATQDQDMGNNASVLDSSSLRSSRAGAAIARVKQTKQAAVDAMFQSTNGGSRYAAHGQARAGSKRTAESVDCSSVTTNGLLGHKRAKSNSYEESNGTMARPTATASPEADVLKRSSFLGFSLGSDATHRTSTTKSIYFRMKAMGLKPNRSARPGAERGTKRSRSDSMDAASPRLNASSLARLDAHHDQDRALMPPPSGRSVRSKTDEDDEALFARLRAAREALKESETFMRSEVAKEEDLRRSRSASQSDGESPSLQRARAEARLRSSGNSELGGSVNNRDVPAYRLRESKFVPREQYSRAIERANEIRASRSAQNSRPTSRTEVREVDSPFKTTGTNSFGLGDGSGGAVATSAQPTPAKQPAPVATHFGASSAFDQGSRSAKPLNPFSQWSSFAVGSNVANPFLQGAQSRPNGNSSHRVIESTSQGKSAANEFTGFAGFGDQTVTGQSRNSFSQQPSWSFTTALEGPEQSQDHTIQPSLIPEALSASFGHQEVAHQSPFAPTSKGSPTPPANSYMPSHAASAAISLLSDDEDEVTQEDQGGQDLAYGQAQFFNQVNAAAAAAAAELDEFVVDLPGHANKYAALANYDDGDADDQEDSPAGGDEVDDEAGQSESYQYGPPLTEEDLQDDEDEDIEHDASDPPNGQYMDEYSDDEDGYGDGDVEDEDDFGEEGEEYDEDEESEGDPGVYANGHQNQYGRQVYAVPPKRQVNEALQQVGNDEKEPIELSD